MTDKGPRSPGELAPIPIAERYRCGLTVKQEPVPTCFVSIDPGAVHCGIAHWEVSRVDCASSRFCQQLGDHPPHWRATCVEAYERTPLALYLELENGDYQRDGVGLVVCEDFQLQKGRNQQGSRMETPKTIGVIEYICTSRIKLPFRLQPPSIKSNADAWLRLREVDPTLLASNDHKRDAVRHGVYYLWRGTGDAVQRNRAGRVALRVERGPKAEALQSRVAKSALLP